MKYPLTDKAKEEARQLVEWWDNGTIQQRIKVTIYETTDLEIVELESGQTLPPKSIWWELSKFNLVDMVQTDTGKWDIYLLQELRNAVATDFEVSEYFLTLNAVGNIIINSTTGHVQGTGYNTGISNMTIEAAADQLEEKLGAGFLAEQQALKEAIDALRIAVDSDRQSKLGKVISELGNCLQHGANTYAVTQALAALAPALRPLLGL